MNIKEMSSTMTTSQMLYKLRKEFSDKVILAMAIECSRGMYDSFYSVIKKEVSSNRYSSEEREVIETND